ncbi:Protein of unknown function [Pyronema omphalodes CBS 100304]|uniref:Uncharacterized protein n=1 Tax=Pyronema omphalodes (strain CBS 100304) TaxID=1076935 RepID=U4LLL0_PYROM|nr:Protein of unknown function [Pyronema omphalodes CBS 100304]
MNIPEYTGSYPFFDLPPTLCITTTSKQAPDISNRIALLSVRVDITPQGIHGLNIPVAVYSDFLRRPSGVPTTI